MSWVVYGLFDLAGPGSGLRYVGKSDDMLSRLEEHWWSVKDGHTTHKANWMKKVGRQNVMVMRMAGPFPTEREAFFDERRLIMKHRVMGNRLTNGTWGGEGGSPTMETRAKLSVSSKAAHARPEVREKISAALKVSQARPEVREKITAASKVNNTRPEVRAKISAALKASPCSSRDESEAIGFVKGGPCSSRGQSQRLSFVKGIQRKTRGESEDRSGSEGSTCPKAGTAGLCRNSFTADEDRGGAWRRGPRGDKGE